MRAFVKNRVQCRHVGTVFETDFNEKIQKPSFCERARWIESCPVFGYPSGIDGAILPAQDYLLCPARKTSLQDR